MRLLHLQRKRKANRSSVTITKTLPSRAAHQIRYSQQSYQSHHPFHRRQLLSRLLRPHLLAPTHQLQSDRDLRQLHLIQPPDLLHQHLRQSRIIKPHLPRNYHPGRNCSHPMWLLVHESVVAVRATTSRRHKRDRLYRSTPSGYQRSENKHHQSGICQSLCRLQSWRGEAYPQRLR